MKRGTLETFLTLARLKHFGKTAAHLNTTQSTVSIRIANLEKDLNVSLFDRTAGKVTLTPQGHDLLDKAADVLESMDRLSLAAGSDPYRTGTLRLALSETLAATILPGFLEAFAQSRPNADVEMSVDSTVGQRARLLSREVDLAFLMGPVSQPRIANMPLIELPMTWVLSRTHPLAGQDELSLADLSNNAITTYANDSRPYVELVDAMTRAGIKRPKLFSSNALGASLSITKAGLAVATMPKVFTAEHIAEGTLREVATPITLNPLTFTASYRIEIGNDLARAAAELAVKVAGRWQLSSI